MTQSPREEIRTDLAALAPAGLDVVLSSDAWRDYGVPGSPHVVSVDGRTGRPPQTVIKRRSRGVGVGEPG